MMNWNKILKEWSYRVGVIKPRDKKHLHQLNEILKEEGWPYTVVNEIVQNLTEQRKLSKEDINLLRNFGALQSVSDEDLVDIIDDKVNLSQFN